MCLLTAPTLSQCHMDLCGHTLDIVIYSKSAFLVVLEMGVSVCPLPLLWLVVFTIACTNARAITTAATSVCVCVRVRLLLYSYARLYC